ncbi:MAG TPA: M42 family metallopeptidase [Bacillota bacterium]|jgi:endoglucanase
MLRDLTDASGISGYEFEARATVRRYLEQAATIEHDNLGSIIGKQVGVTDRPRIMLAGHMDEVGFMVTGITKEGFLRFQTIGGWWEQVMLAQRVTVKTHRGDLAGIVGSKPPHILSAEDRKKVVEKKDMFIDVGATDEEEAKKLGVRPGDPVIPVSPFTVMGNGQALMAKAWDDRIGCAIFIDVLRNLKNEPHPNTLYGVGTVQEEVGLRGATTSVEAVDPDVGFAMEVSIAGDMPGVKENEATDRLGGGPSILVYDGSMIPNLRLRDLVVETAEKEKIPYQFSAMPGGGTDAGRIHVHGQGVPSLVIGVPCRYIHSHSGIIRREDYDHTVRLLTAVVKRLDARTVSSLTA